MFLYIYVESSSYGCGLLIFCSPLSPWLSFCFARPLAWRWAKMCHLRTFVDRSNIYLHFFVAWRHVLKFVSTTRTSAHNITITMMIFVCDGVEQDSNRIFFLCFCVVRSTQPSIYPSIDAIALSEIRPNFVQHKRNPIVDFFFLFAFVATRCGPCSSVSYNR